MGEVVDIFSGQPVSAPPAAEESDFVEEFCNHALWDLIGSVQELAGSDDEAEFRKWMNDIRKQVAEWPE